MLCAAASVQTKEWPFGPLIANFFTTLIDSYGDSSNKLVVFIGGMEYHQFELFFLSEAIESFIDIMVFSNRPPLAACEQPSAWLSRFFPFREDRKG
jgi:hypothetical protein